MIIGLDDDGKALGLDGDFSTLARGQGRDRFEQVFASIITEYLDEAQQYIHSCFEEYQGKLIYVVAVDKRVPGRFSVYLMGSMNSMLENSPQQEN